MLFKCYRSWASEDIQQQIWQYAEYAHAYSVRGVCEFYIREDRLSFALLIDPVMTHIPAKDFID